MISRHARRNAAETGLGNLPLPGVILDIVDPKGEVLGANREGYSDHTSSLAKHDPHHLGAIRIALRNSTGGGCPGSYFTGDAARRDEGGYYWVLGRVDDVMNVSGHRLSTMEVESRAGSSSRRGRSGRGRQAA